MKQELTARDLWEAVIPPSCFGGGLWKRMVSELTLFFPYKVADCMTRFIHLVPGTSLAPHTETLADSTASVLGEFPLPS